MEGQRDLPHRFVAIVAMFTTDFYVCGIAPLEPNLLVLLTFDEKDPKMEAGKPVKLEIIASLILNDFPSINQLINQSIDPANRAPYID